jgi:hypothetical protein
MDIPQVFSILIRIIILICYCVVFWVLRRVLDTLYTAIDLLEYDLHEIHNDINRRGYKVDEGWTARFISKMQGIYYVLVTIGILLVDVAITACTITLIKNL